MANVVLKDIVKIYPYIDKEKKNKKKTDTPAKKINLQITDKGVVAVQKFNLDIKDGEFIVLVGPSGCGKSTTLRMIAGLEEISEGELVIDGRVVNAIEPKDRDIAMVFQNYALYPHMTVYDNIAYSLKIRKIPDVKVVKDKDGNEVQKQITRHYTKAEIREKVLAAAETLNITEYLQRRPRNLSGGQRQRVAIGRAIVRKPKVLLMDEPLSNLDAKLRNQMRAEIIKLREKINTTFIYVTHDQTEAMTLGDRIVVMKDGFIQQVGTPQEVFEHPKNLFVSGFIGSPQMNYYDASLEEKNGEYSVVCSNGYTVKLSEDKQQRLAKNGIKSQKVILGVRPDHLSIAKEGLSGKVTVSELMGTSSHLHVVIDGKDSIVIVQNKGKYINYMGQELTFGFNGDIAHVFDPETEKNLEYFE